MAGASPPAAVTILNLAVYFAILCFTRRHNAADVEVALGAYPIDVVDDNVVRWGFIVILDYVFSRLEGVENTNFM